MSDERPKYLVIAELEASHSRKFKTERGAKKYLQVLEAKLKEANKLADGVIWTTIDLVYETRWDCSMARLAAA